jgi:multiple sugar transport system permease protein
MSHTIADTQLKKPKRTAKIIIMIVLILMAGYFLLPLVWLLIASTKTTSDLFSTGMFAFSKDFAFFRNLAEVNTYGGGYFWRWYLNSTMYSSVTAVLGTLICTLAGYATSMYQFRGRKLFGGLILASLIVPAAALTLPTFLLIKFLGMMNSYAGVIVPGLASAFGAYFLSTYISQAMPRELMDSGRVDGVGDWNIFWRIALPVIRPGVVTYFLISFIGSWNYFFLPLLILNDPAKFPLTLGLNSWVAFINSAGQGLPPYSQIVTGSLLSVLPMIVLFPFFGSQIASGMATGSVKM